MNNNKSVHGARHPALHIFHSASKPLRCPAPTLNRSALRWFICFLLGVLIVSYGLVFLHLWSRLAHEHSDFVAFYSAGQIVRRGLGRDLYNRQVLARLQSEAAPQLVNKLQGPLPYIHPPFEAALFAPLAGLPYPTAFAVWDIVGALALAGSALLLRPSVPRLRRWSRPLPLLCAFAFFPAFWLLLMGQDSAVLLLLLVGSFVALKHRRDFAAGICFGFALIKFQFVIPILAMFLLRRKIAVLAGFSATAAILTIASVAIAGLGATFHYPHTVLLYAWFQHDPGMIAQNMPNLRGIIERLLGSGTLANGILAMVSVALVVFVARRCRFDPRLPAFALEYSLAITVATAISYHVERHDLVLLLIPLLLAGNELFAPSMSRRAKALLLPAVFVMFFIPLPIVLASPNGSSEGLAMFIALAFLSAGITFAMHEQRHLSTRWPPPT